MRTNPFARSTRAMAAYGAMLVVLAGAGCAAGAEQSVASSRAGKFDAALREACASGEIVPATSLISEKWDRMLVMPEGSYGYMVNDILGFHYTNDNSYYGSGYTGFILNGEQKVVEFNYTFSDNAPPAELPAYGHIFDAESLNVTPRSKTPESMQRWLKHRGLDCILLSPDDPDAFTH